MSGTGPGRGSGRDHGSALEIVIAPGCVIGPVHRIAVTETGIDPAIEELDHGHATDRGTVRETDIDDAEAEMIAEDAMKKSRKSFPRRNCLVSKRKLWPICYAIASVWLPSSLSWKLTRSLSHPLERLCLHRLSSLSAETVPKLQR